MLPRVATLRKTLHMCTGSGCAVTHVVVMMLFIINMSAVNHANCESERARQLNVFLFSIMKFYDHRRSHTCIHMYYHLLAYVEQHSLVTPSMVMLSLLVVGCQLFIWCHVFGPSVRQGRGQRRPGFLAMVVESFG